MDLPYIPAENSPTRQQMKAGGGSDSEDDPLDAFMAEVEVRWKLRWNVTDPLMSNQHWVYIKMPKAFLDVEPQNLRVWP